MKKIVEFGKSLSPMPRLMRLNQARKLKTKLAKPVESSSRSLPTRSLLVMAALRKSNFFLL